MTTQIRTPEDGDMSWNYRMVSYVEYIGDPANAKLYRVEGVKLAEVVFHYRAGQWVPDGGYRFVDEIGGEDADDLINEMDYMMQATKHPVIPEKVLSDYSAAIYAEIINANQSGTTRQS